MSDITLVHLKTSYSQRHSLASTLSQNRISDFFQVVLIRNQEAIQSEGNLRGSCTRSRDALQHEYRGRETKSVLGPDYIIALPSMTQMQMEDKSRGHFSFESVLLSPFGLRRQN